MKNLNSAQTPENKSENGFNENLIKGMQIFNNLQAASSGQSGFQRLQGILQTAAAFMGG